MKRLLSNGLVYCATLVFTGRACKETMKPKFKRAKNLIHNDSILNKHQVQDQNKVQDQSILKNIDLTIEEARKIEAYLKQYCTKLVAFLEQAEEAEEAKEAEQNVIPNTRPISKRAAIEPILLFTPDFKSNVANVHKHISDIKKLNMDKTLKTIEDRINMIIDTRKKDDDGQLTEAQKEQLRNLKVIVKKEYSPCWYVIDFYRRASNAINKKHGTIHSVYLDEAKDTNKNLSNTIQETNKLLDLMKIKTNQ